jgi:hypothetical protein
MLFFKSGNLAGIRDRLLQRWILGAVPQQGPFQSRRRTGFAAMPKEVASIYAGWAAIGARALPEEIDDRLLHSWIAVTRGQDPPVPKDLEEFRKSLESFAVWMKDNREAAERRGGAEISDSDFQRLLIYALLQDASLSLRQGCAIVLDAIGAGHLDLAPEEDLRAAYNAAKGEICGWLSALEFEFHTDPSVILPICAHMNALAPFAGRPGICFSPDIPEKQLLNAWGACGVPDIEQIAVLVDCTIFGAADEAVLFGTRGMYYNDGVQSGHIPYSSFPSRTFNNVPDQEAQLSLGGGEILDLAKSEASARDILAVLEALKQEACTRKRRMSRHDDLPSEPTVGESIGLATMGDDGAILRIETQATVGQGRIVPLGSLEPVMRESIEAAAQYVRANYGDLGIPETWAQHYDVAVLAPSIAEAKDGPSAGLPIVAGIVSALTSRPVRNNLAMTGEITLKGRVLRIGALEIKVRAAYEAGIVEVLFPAENLPEIKHIPHYIRDVVRLRAVSTVGEMLDQALLPATRAAGRGRP